ncbi:MAG: FG-GAP repeat protein [Planctomycetota bacterium]
MRLTAFLVLLVLLVTTVPTDAHAQLVVEDRTLGAADPDPSDAFGSAIDTDGDRLVVCASGDDSWSTDGGAAYVFDRLPNGTWAQTQKLVPGAGAVGGRVTSVAVSGDVVVLGNSTDDVIALDAGAVYVFERQLGGAWTQVATLTAPDGLGNDRFGSAVDVPGDRIVVGAMFDDEGGFDDGSGYVFERTPGGSWIRGETGQCRSANHATYRRQHLARRRSRDPGRTRSQRHLHGQIFERQVRHLDRGREALPRRHPVRPLHELRFRRGDPR